MASQEDLDWLYGRDRPDAQPEHSPDAPAPSSGARSPEPPRSSGWPKPLPVEPPAPAAVSRPEPRPAPRPQPAPAGATDALRTPPPRPSGPPPAPPVRRRPHHPATYWVRRLLVLAVLLIVVWVGFLIFTPLHFMGQITRLDNTPDGARPGTHPGTAILITGSDSREGLTPEQAERLGVGGDQDAGRTDTMMLLYVPPSGKPALISLPRDAYVDIPGNGASKLNAAYAWGGPKLLTQTVEQDFGLRIDGYAEVGFAGFALLVDAVGGVDICVQEDIPAESVYPEIKAGCQTLDAPHALWYVRSRHSSALQDLDRIQRQRTFMSALMKKLATPETVINPFRYWEVNKDLSQAVDLGTDTSDSTAFTMLTAMRQISQGKGYTMSLPISNPDYETPAGSSVQLNDQLCDELFAQLNRGDTSNLEKYQQ